MLPRRSSRCLPVAGGVLALVAARAGAGEGVPRQWGSAFGAVPPDLPAWRALYEEARRRHGFPWEAAWAFAPAASNGFPARETLDRIAAVGGGRAFYTDRIAELDGAFSEIAEDLASQYLLAYDAGEAAEPGRWRTIRVDVVGPGYKVRARQGYRVPARRR